MVSYGILLCGGKSNMIINIANKIQEKNLNLAIVAKEAGCTYKNLHNLCNGKTQSIRFDILEKLCNILNCGVEELLILEEESNEDYSI